jgi:two-component system OmpR family sensor kinase
VADSQVLSEILEDLLIAADPRETAERSPLDLGDVADMALAALQVEANTRGITLQRIGNRAPAPVVGAPVAIRRLYTALITNALDHAKTLVTVAISVQGREAILEVADDGPGFPTGTSDRALERFASARPADPDQQHPRHYGLGLALVAEVVAQHGGRVTIEPALAGRGAVIVVRFPSPGNRESAPRSTSSQKAL